MIRDYSLNRLLALLTTIGFFFLLIDSTIEHWAIFTQDLMAFVPVAFSAVGLVIGTITVLQWKENWIKRLHILLLATFLVAATGLYFHVGEDEDEKQLTSEQRQHEQKEKDKPLLAPLAFSGLAAVGLLGTSRKWKAEIV